MTGRIGPTARDLRQGPEWLGGHGQYVCFLCIASEQILHYANARFLGGSEELSSESMHVPKIISELRLLLANSSFLIVDTSGKKRFENIKGFFALALIL